jgi:hypothetical protein
MKHEPAEGCKTLDGFVSNALDLLAEIELVVYHHFKVLAADVVKVDVAHFHREHGGDPPLVRATISVC